MKPIDINKIYESLCYYDKRNPYYDNENEKPTHEDGQCYCDSCFHGKTKLAEIIVEQYNRLQYIDNTIDEYLKLDAQREAQKNDIDEFVL